MSGELFHHPEQQRRLLGDYDPEERLFVDAPVARAAAAALEVYAEAVPTLSEYREMAGRILCPAAVSATEPDAILPDRAALTGWLEELRARLLDELDGLPEGHPTRPRYADLIAARNAIAALSRAVEDDSGGLPEALVHLLGEHLGGRDRAGVASATAALRDELAEALPLPAPGAQIPRATDSGDQGL